MQPRLDVRPDEQALVPRLATEPMSQAYDTAEPVWLEEVRSDDAPSHLHAAGRRRRTLLLGGASLAAGGLVGVGALLVRGADGWSGAHLPVVFTAQAMARSVLATPAAQSTRESSAKPSAVIGRESTNAASPAAPSDAAGPSLRSPDMRIAVGAHHGCRLTPTYGAECWTLAAAEPVPAPANAVEVEGWMPARAGELRAVPGVMRYTALAAGSAHTCGVTPEGDIYCWGANDVGQLGDGTRVSRTAPVRVAGPASYRAVRGGRAHTCGLETGGAVRCWGENRSGQLGDGTLTSEPVPTAVVGLPALAVAVATGAQHSCALLGDGRVFCWGANRDGQLGVPGRTERSEPREVAGVRATAIGAGDAHTCAALTTGGVRCWGRDAAGQLGVGPLSTHASDIAPGRLTTVPDADHVTSLAGGASQSCAMTPSGAVWCWGGAGRASRVPVRIAMAGSVSFSAGADETCTIGSDDHPTCWVQARSVGERQSVGGSTPQPVASRMHGSRPHSPAHRLRTRH